MKKLFISQPMNGLTKEEIFAVREKAVKDAEKRMGTSFIVLDTFILEDAPEYFTIGIWYLAKSLEMLAEADVVYFCDGWEDARGCRIEHDCAVNYGVTVIEETQKENQYMKKYDFKDWIKAAGVRAVKTIAQTAIATIGTAAVLGSVDWVMVASASALAGILSLLTSVAGLPELD